MEKIIKRKKIFLRFLKEHKCYKEYCKNYNNNSEFDSFPYFSLNDLYDDNEKNEDCNVSNEIYDAFSWDESNEGFEFWSEVDDDWTNFYDYNIKAIG